jgi:hypothetical protein
MIIIEHLLNIIKVTMMIVIISKNINKRQNWSSLILFTGELNSNNYINLILLYQVE